ncbi:MAG: DM13 domain-containing protein [Actinobacteria bacterium]|nr:DM13 domain-containing protein [Actinomycetota bacterium]
MAGNDRVRARLRQAATVVGLVALAASAAYGGDLFGVRSALQDTAAPAERSPAVGRVAGDSPSATPAATRVRSAAWWQTVDTLEGTGPATQEVAIGDGALQWRARVSCRSGNLAVTVASRADPLIQAACPGEDVGYATHTGPTHLAVQTDGAWTLVVEQQIDVPLVEPPLPQMQSDEAEVVAAGSFYDIDQTGRGQVAIYRLGDGSHALRLEDFFVTPNVDLEIRLSPLAAPETTEDYLSADAALVAVLDATAGSMNFPVPAGIDPTAFRSVVIWCPPIDSAYAAASLAPPDR